MTFVSLAFLAFLAITIFLYYIMPIRLRWYVLLIASICFYLYAGWEAFIFVVASAFVAFMSARWIEKIYSKLSDESKQVVQKKRRKARSVLVLGILLVISLLLYSKLGQRTIDLLENFNNFDFSGVSIIVPLGISYYTFSVIGYMADVYWKKDKAEHNFLKLLLYMIFFPQILQGPIPKHKKLAVQLVEGHAFEYKRFCFGLQRIIWGYFKKMVIADRFAVIVTEIFQQYRNYEGQFFVIAILASTLQLYCDFSGCMDIVLGISECLGIQLEENFKRPFFSRSAAEFWRRWHITLGAWFKDYIYMPMVINPSLIRISQLIKDKFGNRLAKTVMSALPLAVVWILTGLWHGTGIDYIIWGVYWGVIIILSTIFAPEIKKFTTFLHIDPQSKYWQLWQMFRTFLFFCGGRLLTAPGDIQITGYAIKSMFTNFNPWIYVDGSLYKLGLDRQDMWIGIFAVVILCMMSILQEKQIKIREKIASFPLLIRWSIYYGAILAILIFGMYGSGHDNNSFVYMQY